MYRDYNSEILGAEQQRKTAQLLRSQAMKAPEGQMISGWYVPPSWTQYAAQAMGQYFANDKEKEATASLNEIQKQKALATAEALRGLKAQPKPNAEGTQSVMTAPTDQQRIESLLTLSQINPEAAQVPMKLEEYGMTRQDKKDAMTQAQQDKLEQLRLMAELKSQNPNGGEKSYFQPLQTADGVYAFNARTGKVEKVQDQNGKAVVGAQNDPKLQGTLSHAKAGGTIEGQTETNAKVNLDQTLAQGNNTLKEIDDLLAHPGLHSAVGFGSEITKFAPSGSDTRTFLTRLDQLKGGQFLQAYQTLKGGGQITEVEGKKATDAMARMNTSSSEKEFRQATKDYAEVIKAGMERAKRQAQGNFAPVSTAQPSAGGAKFLGFE